MCGWQLLALKPDGGGRLLVVLVLVVKLGGVAVKAGEKFESDGLVVLGGGISGQKFMWWWRQTVVAVSGVHSFSASGGSKKAVVAAVVSSKTLAAIFSCFPAEKIRHRKSRDCGSAICRNFSAGGRQAMVLLRLSGRAGVVQQRWPGMLR